MGNFRWDQPGARFCRPVSQSDRSIVRLSPRADFVHVGKSRNTLFRKWSTYPPLVKGMLNQQQMASIDLGQDFRRGDRLHHCTHMCIANCCSFSWFSKSSEYCFRETNPSFLTLCEYDGLWQRNDIPTEQDRWDWSQCSSSSSSSYPSSPLMIVSWDVL